MNRDAEWLEADGLGGFASGTVGGLRTRRYHALLLTATTPPTGRINLVNGFDASVETPSGSFAISSQRYAPDVIHPDGSTRIERYEPDPWPTWTYRLEDGTRVEQSIFVPHGKSLAVLTWRLLEPRDRARLVVRPFLSGRDYHSLHHENLAVRFDAQIGEGRGIGFRRAPRGRGLPVPLLEGERARHVVDAVEARLWTPLGLRSLAPDSPGYAPHYQGGVRERDGAYHQGTVWPWLTGPFVEAWLRVHGGTSEAKRDARARFLEPLLQHLDDAGLGHICEIADAEPPHTPRGCPFQAWSVGEALRLAEVVLAEPDSRVTANVVVASNVSSSKKGDSPDSPVAAKPLSPGNLT